MKSTKNMLSRSRVCGAVLLSLVVLSTAGCGIGAKSEPGTIAIPAMQGTVFGGQNPIVGATISLYSVGLPSTGGSYGGGQTSLLTSAVTTVSGGSFSITGDYPQASCTSGSYVYIEATGGNPGSGTNSSVALIAALGECSSLSSSTSIDINEATTVAAVWALQQFATATFGTANTFTVGAPSTNVIGLENAFATAANIVTTTNGSIPTSTAVTGTVNSTTVTVNVTNDSPGRIATLANILASCINSADQAGNTPSAACTSLFNSVKPSGQSSAAADTVQAALDMARNPTNVGTASTPPFSLASTSPPFSGGLSTPPNDWTLALTYSSPTLLGTSPTQNYFMYKGYAMAIDGNGNVWVVNGPGGTTSSPYYNSVAEISPGGKPLANVLSGTTLATPRGIAIDTAGDVWVADDGTIVKPLFEYSTGGATTSFSYAQALYGIAIDASNNVFAAGTTKLMELTSGGSTPASIANIGSASETVAIDPSSNVWVPSESGSLYYFAATCTSSPCTYPANGTAITVPTPFGVAIDQNGIPWTSDYTSNEISKIASTSSVTTSAASLGGLDEAEYMAFDGSSNLWTTNYLGASVTEISSGSTTVALSPSAGFTHTFDGARGIGIDASGNVWVSDLNGATATTTPVLTEVVGAATPAVTPLSEALALGKVGKLP